MSNCAEYSIELRRIPKVFDFEYDFYDDQFKCEFEAKFLDHYAFCEIGFETIDRFKHQLRSHLNLNAPYWQQLYETELESQGITFLLNKDLKETWIRTLDTEDNVKGNVKNSNSQNTNTISKVSNINDGVASVGLTQGLVTGMSDNQDMTLGSNSTDNNENRTGKQTEKYELISQGNIGTTSSAELLDKWRESLINIDQIIIDSCQDLFMGIY